MIIDEDLLIKEINEMGFYIDRHVNKNTHLNYFASFEQLVELLSTINGNSYIVSLFANRVPGIYENTENKNYDGIDRVLFETANNSEMINNLFSNFILTLHNNSFYERYPKKIGKPFTEKDFKEIMLDFYGNIGNREYNIVKKYFDENRIQIGNIFYYLDDNAGTFYFNQLKDTGYILLPFDRIDTCNLIYGSHEFGHAMDFHITKSQRKQMTNSLHGGMFIELPSVFFETLFIEYLIENHIDLDTVYTMKNDMYVSICRAYEGLTNYYENYKNNIAVDPYGCIPYLIEGSDDINYTCFGEYIDSASGKLVPIRNHIIYNFANLISFNLNELYKLDKKETLKNFYNTMTTCDLFNFKTNLENLGLDLKTFEDCSLIKGDIVKTLKEVNKRY